MLYNNNFQVFCLNPYFFLNIFLPAKMFRLFLRYGQANIWPIVGEVGGGGAKFDSEGGLTNQRP